MEPVEQACSSLSRGRGLKYVTISLEQDAWGTCLRGKGKGNSCCVQLYLNTQNQ
jgi:hypothetical protein